MHLTYSYINHHNIIYLFLHTKSPCEKLSSQLSRMILNCRNMEKFVYHSSDWITLYPHIARHVFVSIVNCCQVGRCSHTSKKKRKIIRVGRRRIKVIFFFFEFNTGAISSCISTEQKVPLYLKTVHDGWNAAAEK